MHHIDLGLFKYQFEFTKEILKNVGGNNLLKNFDDCLRQIPHFPNLKLFNKFEQLKVITASDYRHIMKIAIFALDDIFDRWSEITCNELCELFAKFGKIYIMSRKESFTQNDLKTFEINISKNFTLIIIQNNNINY